MKLLLLLIPIFAFAQSFIVSDIPLPKTYVENLDPYECNDECLQEYLNKGMIFSFLAHSNHKLSDANLQEIRQLNRSILNLDTLNNTQSINIAIILPYKKIGRYATSTTNALFAYMISNNNPFTIKTYKIESEGVNDIEFALTKIQNDGFKYVIAPFTLEGAQNMIELNPDLTIYFPTINKDDVATDSKYLYFGGIDYKQQSKLLLQNASSPLVIFSDKSRTGQNLAKFQKTEYLESSQKLPIRKRVVKYSISRKTTNLEYYIKKNKRIDNGSFLINTPIVKTSMIISQLTLYDTNVNNILSTQINYNPLILSMTQYRDRKNMIIANSITTNNDVIIQNNTILHNDIVYNWINYSTTIGCDYFYSLITGQDRKYQIPIQDHQVVYDINLVKPGISNFYKY